MAPRKVELVYFVGCPNVELARKNLRLALEASGMVSRWEEWDLGADRTPQRYRRHGSPTVLVDGLDVTGSTAQAVAMACRSDGAPSVSTIVAGLARPTPPAQ